MDQLSEEVPDRERWPDVAPNRAEVTAWWPIGWWHSVVGKVSLSEGPGSSPACNEDHSCHRSQLVGLLRPSLDLGGKANGGTRSYYWQAARTVKPFGPCLMVRGCAAASRSRPRSVTSPFC